MKRNYEMEFEGFEEKLGKDTYVFPALNFFSLKVLGPKIATLMECSYEERIEIILEVIHSSVRLNYDYLTYEDIQRIVPVNKAESLFARIMEISELVPKVEEEKKEGDEEAKN